MTFTLLANIASPIERFKKDPMGVIRKSHGETVVVIHRNKPAFYAVSPARYRAMLDLLNASNQGAPLD